MPVGKILELTTDPNTGEKYNLHASGEKEYQLRRFLKLMGMTYDEVLGLIKNFEAIFDVDKCDADMLQYLAALLGFNVNYDLPIPAQRREIKNAVNTYKLKGTLPGIESAVEGITQMTVYIKEERKNILISNRSDRRSAAVLDPEEMGKNRGPFETLDRTPALATGSGGGQHNMNSWTVYIMVPIDKTLSGAMLAKIDRLLLEFAPVNTTPFVIPIDEINDEAYDLAGITEGAYDDEVEDIVDETLVREITMISNDATKRSNSTSARSLRTFYGEEWWDEIEETQTDEDMRNSLYEMRSNDVDKRSNSLWAKSANVPWADDYDDTIYEVLPTTTDDEDIAANRNAVSNSVSSRSNDPDARSARVVWTDGSDDDIITQATESFDTWQNGSPASSRLFKNINNFWLWNAGLPTLTGSP